ncbi:MAG: energy-coupling factor transporter ATPase [Bacilli bacterium]|nr:energy-coupling factor transporter ATPase [Bacilli bacterium]
MPIKFINVSHIYSPKTPMRFDALKNINLDLDEKKFTALVGKTGSGKSTLINHINGLLHPTEGKVLAFDYVNSSNKKERTKNVKDLRKRIGLVFQFPEYQLFEETVEKDVAFGPRNFGIPQEEAIKQAHEALLQIGLDESFFTRSPFDLSGGEKRKVAIAGILAIHPDVLILDEPTAGLDPKAAEDTMELFKEINKSGVGIIFVTHDMNLVLEYAEEVVVMDEGEVAKQCSPEELFGEDLSKYSLQNPDIYRFALMMKEKGIDLKLDGLNDVNSLAKAIKESKK